MPEDTEVKCWYAVHVSTSKRPEDPVAIFKWQDVASGFGKRNYPGRYGILKCQPPVQKQHGDRVETTVCEDTGQVAVSSPGRSQGLR